MRLTIPVVVTLLLVACGRPGGDVVVRPCHPARFRVVREYGYEASVADPRPRWNPTNHALVARSAGGITVYREGRDVQETFQANDGSDCYDPTWADGTHIVLGPDPTVRLDREGGLILPQGGIRVVEYTRKGLEHARIISERGYRPAVWDDRALVQWGELILLIPLDLGDGEAFLPGFYPVPQPTLPDGRPGQGLCYNDSPLRERDHWGLEGLGTLQIRWGADEDVAVVDAIPRAYQPDWTPRGGILATCLPPGWEPGPDGVDAPPPGTVVVHRAGPGAEIEVLAPGAHSPAAHPRYDVFACVDSAGDIRLYSMDGMADVVLARQGREPRWSHDGKCLMFTRPEGETARIVVLVIDVSEADVPDLTVAPTP